MNNRLMLLVLMVVICFGSCKTKAKLNNAQKDIHAPKRINNTKPVIIPDVDVDEILRKNPPQYQNPEHKMDMEEPKSDPKSNYHQKTNND
jgi:hypothetical protein